jgi:hypothetical protein
VEFQVIQLSRLRLANNLPGFVEALQGHGVVGEILVENSRRRSQAHGLLGQLESLFVLALFGVDQAPIVVGLGFAWVIINLLLIGLSRFVQFSGDIAIVGGDNRRLLALR